VVRGTLVDEPCGNDDFRLQTSPRRADHASVATVGNQRGAVVSLERRYEVGSSAALKMSP
jgi:hypothetical protein